MHAKVLSEYAHYVREYVCFWSVNFLLKYYGPNCKVILLFYQENNAKGKCINQIAQMIVFPFHMLASFSISVMSLPIKNTF